MKKNNFFLLILYIYTGHIYAAHDSSTLHRYFWANYKQFSGDITHAQDWYTKIFSSNAPYYCYKGYIHFLADTKQFKKILELIPPLEKRFINDPNIQLIFAQAMEKIDQKKADDKFIVLCGHFKTNSEITVNAAQAYIRRKEPEKALLTIDTFLNNTPCRANNFIFYFFKTQLCAQLNQFDKALESIHKCLDLYPYYDKGWLLYASLYEKEGDIQKALSGYSTFLGLAGNNETIEKHMLTLMLKHKTINNKNSMALPYSATIDNALILFRQRRYAHALTLINNCIEQQPHDNECKLLKIQILSAMKNFDQITDTLTSLIIAEPENELWPKTLFLLIHSDMPREQIIKTFSQILQKNPANIWCHLYCTDLFMRDAKNDLAINQLEKSLLHSMPDTIRAKILYQLALLHYEQAHYDAMYNNLNKAHQLNPQCPHINNAIAYYWATKGKNLSQAHFFIKKSLDIDNKNPYFLDTKALILYKEKKYLEAQNLLENLNDHNSSTIFLHLAKIHYAQDNKEIARAFTQKARQSTTRNYEKKSLKKMELLLAHL